MTPRAEHIARLIRRNLTGQLTPEEAGELNAWVALSEEHAALFDEVHDGTALEQMLRQKKEYDKERMITALREQFPEMIRSGDNPPKTVHRVHFLKTAWFRYAAAFIILFGIGAYLWDTQQKEKPLITKSKPVPVKNDIAPGFDRAVLTLSNGQRVELNNAVSETIKDGTLSIKNTNGQLSYADNGSLHSPFGKGGSSGSQRNADRRGISYNTMQTPRGGQYKLTLADGTKVWLNAASSITYPVTFTNNTREVSITGEAYFEVSKNPSKPFIVKTPKEDITVLGTSFNVNAYEDEHSVKASLLEGSVRIANVVLKPGQAYMNGSVVRTNIEQEIAWKNGVFSFVDADIKAVMRQLARWYDVEINYEGTIPQGNFSGEIGRNLTLSEVLTELGSYGFSYKIEGKTVSISQ